MPAIDDYIGKVHQIDALELMKALPDASIDLILTDPPYAVHEVEWDKLFDIPAFWTEAKRIIKPCHAIAITCVMRLAWQLIAANPNWFKYDMVGIKNVATDFLNAHNKPMRQHENILIFSDGTTANCSPNKMVFYPQIIYPAHPKIKKDYADTKQKSVFGTKGRSAFSKDQIRISNGNLPTTLISMDTQNREGNLHPNQKDIDVFDYLIRTYTQPSDIVLDPFAGSGTTGVAARNLERRYILGDTDASYCEIARRRLDEPFTRNMFIEQEKQESAVQLSML